MKKIGRPNGTNNKDCVCTIRLDEKTLYKLENYCQLTKKQKSKVIRDAINMVIDDNTKSNTTESNP